MTDPVPGARTRAPIDQGMFLDIHGVPQWVTLRGADRANPLLMLLTGPGVAFSRLARFFAPWEAAFTLVQWDQPGAGSTWARNGDEALSLARLVRDGLEVAEQALARLGASRLVLLGASAGSIVGLMMLKARPELFSAYVGTGQVVHWARQEALSWAMVLEAVRARGDAAAIAELEQIGAPPYASSAPEVIKSKYAGAVTEAEQAVFAGLHPSIMASAAAPPDGANWVARGLEPPDQRMRAMACWEVLRQEIGRFDAYALGRRFEAPMVFLQGTEDAYTVSSLVRDYAEWLDAPLKRYVPVEGGGHSALFLRERFGELLVRHARPLAR
jgi:pimeloyl-ACP methyl ester carboxylesterase